MKTNISNEENHVFIEGIISVNAVLTSGKRRIYNIFIDKAKYEKRDRKITHLVSMLKKLSVPFSLSDRSYIDLLAEGSSHGGVIAEVGDRCFCALQDVLLSLKDNTYAVMLDGVEDPFNFGYSIRNLFAFGCKSFIIPKRNWMTASNIVATSSAGASELCDMAIIDSDEELVSCLKESGVEIVCSALSSSSVPIFKFKPNNPFVLFIGGEKRGISKTFMENADKVVHIPYNNDHAKYSLPTASCAAIFGSYLSDR